MEYDITHIAEFVIGQQNSTKGFNKKYPNLLKQLKPLTTFLSDGANIHHRLWHIYHKQTTPPQCANLCCENSTKWSVRKNQYNTCCGRLCNANHTDFKHKRAQTLFRNHGVDNPMHSPEIVGKQQQTTHQRYGVSNISQHKQSIADKQQRMIEATGFINPSQSPSAIHKIRQSKLTEYQIHQLSKPQLERLHTVEHKSAIQIATELNVHHSTVLRAIKKHNIPLLQTMYQIPQETILCLDDEVNLRKLHQIDKLTLTDIAELYSVNVTTLSNRFKQFEIPIIHYNTPSNAENSLAAFVQTLVDVDLVRNTKSIIAPMELDIYIPSLKIAIEYNGLYWHSNAHSRIHNNYHLDKLNKCKAKGIRLITIFENEWIHKQHIVMDKLKHILSKSNQPKVYARQTTFGVVDKNVAKQFIDLNHIQGAQKSFSSAFGLYYRDQLISVITFTKRSKYMELTRFCSSCSVVGGFSKLVKNAHKILNSNQYVSFADMRWSVGGVYEKTGWALDKILPPDYKYIEGDKLIHKFNYRHNNLHNKLTTYDPTKSELCNTINNNVFRVYDCGLARYVLDV